MKKAVVLVSGGLDSATALACATKDGFEVRAVTFDYGQRHRAELTNAARVAQSLEVREHVVISVDLRGIGGSALTAGIDVPKYREIPDAEPEIPITYVPARNTIFLSLALALAEARGAFDLFIGANAMDYSGYPDCRPEFINAFERVANVGTKAGTDGGQFLVHAPLIAMTKAEIIRLGVSLGVDYSLTLSCYDPGPSGEPCGGCDACQLRRKGFKEAGMDDPALSGKVRTSGGRTQ